MTKPYFVNHLNEDDLFGRLPQNIKSGLSQQPLIGSYSNFKLRLRRPKQSVQIFQWRQSPIEHIKSGISQQPLIGLYSNLNLSLDDQTILYKFTIWRRPPMEDKL